MKDKNNHDWIYNLSEKDISRFINYKSTSYLIKDQLKSKILDFDIDSQKPAGASKNISKRTFFNKSVLKFALSFGILLVLVTSFFAYLFYNGQFSTNHLNRCYVLSISGEAYLIKENERTKSVAGEKLDESSVILTGKESRVELDIGNNSIVNINENSSLKLAMLYKDAFRKNSKFFLDTGEIIAHPEKIAPLSSFEVETETIALGVRGTIFKMSIDHEKNTNIQVIEGRVYVLIKINRQVLEKIKNKPVKVKIEKLLDERIILEKNGSFYILYSKFHDSEKIINDLFIEIDEYIKQNGNKIDNAEINGKIEKIRSFKNGIIKTGTGESLETKISEKETEDQKKQEPNNITKAKTKMAEIENAIKNEDYNKAEKLLEEGKSVLEKEYYSKKTEFIREKHRDNKISEGKMKQDLKQKGIDEKKKEDPVNKEQLQKELDDKRSRETPVEKNNEINNQTPKEYGSLEIKVQSEGTLLIDGKEIGAVSIFKPSKLDNTVETGIHDVEVRYKNTDIPAEKYSVTVAKNKKTSLVFSYTGSLHPINGADITFRTDFTAKDLAIHKLTARQSGNNIEFYLEYETKRGRFYAFFDPPNGNTLMFMVNGGLLSNKNGVLFKIPKDKLKKCAEITMRFSTDNNPESDRNFIFLNLTGEIRTFLDIN